MPLTVGPRSPAEDEQRIGSGYKLAAMPFYVLMPCVVAYFSDLKWVVATGFSALLMLQYDAGGRLYDLCIRLRRTNILLSEAAEREINAEFK